MINQWIYAGHEKEVQQNGLFKAFLLHDQTDKIPQEWESYKSSCGKASQRVTSILINPHRKKIYDDIFGNWTLIVFGAVAWREAR